MNREDLDRNLLLAESGELSADARRELDAWLAAHPADAVARDTTRRLLATARLALPAPPASDAVRARLRAAAAEHAARQSAFVFPTVWLRGLAYAAALVLAVAAWFWMAPSPAASDRVSEIHAIVAMSNRASETGDAGTTTHADVAVVAGASEDAQLRALAQELLLMEGLALEEATDEVVLDEAMPTSDGALPPTALQPRSIPAPAAKTYG